MQWRQTVLRRTILIVLLVHSNWLGATVLLNNQEIQGLGLDINLSNISENSLVYTNGLTLTIYPSKADLSLIGFDVYVKRTRHPVSIKILVRPGENHTSPIQQPSDEWTIALEVKNLLVKNALQHFNISLNAPLILELGNPLTVFFLIEEGESLVCLTSETFKNNQDGNLSIESGYGLVDLHQPEPVQNAFFPGQIYYSVYASPTVKPLQTGQVSTLNRAKLNSLTQSYGIIFDFYARQDTTITSIEILTSSINFVEVDVYVKQNLEDELSDWTLVSHVIVMGKGRAQTTLIPQSQFDPIKLHKGATMSFYVRSKQMNILSITTAMAAETIVNIAKEDHIAVLVGQVTLSEDLNPNLGQRRIFAGIIKYQTDLLSYSPSSSPLPITTMSPTISKALASPQDIDISSTQSTSLQTVNDLDPHLETQLKLTIYGISNRRYLRMLLSMENHTIRSYFESVGMSFLQRQLQQSNGDADITITHFIVSLNATRRALLKNRPSNSTLDVYSTVLGEYSPPPIVDFSKLTRSAFDNNGDQFIDELKTSSPEYGISFMEARSIRAETVSFPKSPIPDIVKGEQQPTTDPIDFLTILISVCGAIAFIMIWMIICMAYKKIRSQRKKGSQQRSKQKQNKEKSHKAQSKQDIDNGPLNKSMATGVTDPETSFPHRSSLLYVDYYEDSNYNLVPNASNRWAQKLQSLDQEEEKCSYGGSIGQQSGSLHSEEIDMSDHCSGERSISSDNKEESSKSEDNKSCSGK